MLGACLRRDDGKDVALAPLLDADCTAIEWTPLSLGIPTAPVPSAGYPPDAIMRLVSGLCSAKLAVWGVAPIAPAGRRVIPHRPTQHAHAMQRSDEFRYIFVQELRKECGRLSVFNRWKGEARVRSPPSL